MNDNKLIAEFMGVKYPMLKGSDLQYHTSWDWLMPVLKKINLQIHPDTYGLWRMINTPTEYPIENVHAQAVYFIKEHNNGSTRTS
jgi:hypothetical protein|tara:strand:+ start:48 stop:302 length:255 start_codon:yes stop_codon:yes gene_type:complete